MSAGKIDNRAAFIERTTRLQPAPHAPEISLHMASDVTELWEKTEAELEQIGLPPPFWAFAWAGGQALARYVLDQPECVRGRCVLDFAAGSGLVGIAAKKAGAARVIACEIDEFALEAIRLNARANGVEIELGVGDLVGRDDGWDVVLAGDVSYERDMAERVTAWLAALHRRGALALLGDPGRAYLARDLLQMIAEYDVPVIRDLEDADVKKTGVWTFRAPG